MPTLAEPTGRARRFALARLLRALLVPAAIALPPFFWVAIAAGRASRTPLGRDQGIFQYIAWALRQGQVDYRDIRDVNGPVTHLVHLFFLALGGADDRRFRVLDLVVTGASFAFVGACLPGLHSRRPRPRSDWLERAAWAFAAWVVLSGQYLLFGYWDLAQRESFFDWFMLPSVALQLATQAGHPGSVVASGRRVLGLRCAGALSVVPWFGKPTFALFTVAQVIALLADDARAPSNASRKKSALAFATGAAIAAALAFALLCVYGDPIAFARIQLSDVATLYRFLWPRAAADIFSNAWCATQAIFAMCGAIAFLALIALGEMQKRLIAVALVPVCGLGSVIVQAKGFPYHFHPVTAGVHLQWLAFAAWMTERSRVSRRQSAIVRLAPIAVGLAIALRVASALEDSPHIRASWMLFGGASTAERSTRDYFAHFPESDFFPFEMRQAATYLRAHTKADDRVQSYGMDPYVLFLAERLSATPYIFAYDLDVDAALAGGTGGVPDDAQAERIRGLRDAHEADLLARLQARPPAAFVFLDGAPLMADVDAWADFEEHCARAASWVRAHYTESARFGHDHVWLRSDSTAAPGAAGAEDEQAPPDDR